MEVHQFGLAPLTSHAFNGDRSQVAVCPNTNEVQIYAKHGTEWTLTETLGEHDKIITSIDWAPHTNRIVTASQDRNAYVWNLVPDPHTGQGFWKPTLVLLRINRSATYVRWSPNEEKFAVASGARTIAVCSYDDESNWWISRHIKKPLRSTVLSLDWHPNSILLAAGSADATARVFSAFLKGDAKPPPTVWGNKLPFNTVCGEFSSPAGGWVHGVAFSPSGDALAFASHDSTITVVYPAGEGLPPQAIFTIRSTTLPYIALTFTSEKALVAAGHDCDPVLFEGDSSVGWQYTRSLDDGAARSSASPGPGAPRSGAGGVGRLNNEAFNRFKAADSRGVGGSQSAVGAGARVTGSGTERLTVHQNTITCVRPFEGSVGAVTKVSTSGVDGRLVIWNVAGGHGSITSGIAKMGIH